MFITSKMFFIAPLLVLLLVNINVQSEPTPGAYQKELPEVMKETFQKVNEWYNDDMEWRDRLANLAMEESISPEDSDSEWLLKVQGTGLLDDDDNLKGAVEKVLNATFEDKGLGKNVSGLPSGTKYGCGGFVNKMEIGDNPIMHVGCIYTVNRLV